MIFESDRHKNLFQETLKMMKKTDNYHAALAYVLSLDENLEIGKCFDFKSDSLKLSVFDSPTLTSSDNRVLTFAFSLFNENNNCNLNDVFGFDGFGLYFIQALAIRFGIKL